VNLRKDHYHTDPRSVFIVNLISGAAGQFFDKLFSVVNFKLGASLRNTMCCLASITYISATSASASFHAPPHSKWKLERTK